MRDVHNTALTAQWPACHRWLRARPSSAWKRFNGYNSDRDNILTREELLNMPELTVNPFRERIATVFSSDGSGNMTFEDFLDFLSVFGSKARREPRQKACGRAYRLTCVRTPLPYSCVSPGVRGSQVVVRLPHLRCARGVSLYPAAIAAVLIPLLPPFHPLYAADMDDDGFIGREDLFEVMKLMTGDTFSTDEREQILAKVRRTPAKRADATQRLTLELRVLLGCHGRPQLMEECDLDGDERISFVEFDNVIKRSPDFASYVPRALSASKVGNHVLTMRAFT